MPIGFRWTLPRRGLCAHYMTPRFSNDEWRDKILEMLDGADAADAVIIDVTRMSDSVRWELDRALEHLPAERVLLIADVGDRASVENLRRIGERMCKLPVVWYSPNYLGLAGFKVRLALWLARLR